MPRFAQRRERLRHSLRKHGAGTLLISSSTNVTYLTGFTGDDSYLLVTDRDALMLSDFRYVQQLEEECPGLEMAIRPLGTELLDLVAQVVGACPWRRLAVEGNSMTVGFSAALSGKVPGLEIIPTTGLVEQLREIKDQGEIEEIRHAIDLAERAFSVVRAALRPESTEKSLANELEYHIRLFGGVGCSFTPIVGVGPRGALPHARLSDRRIADSNFVLIDWGARGRLYVSDLTRVLVTGRISPKLERIYGLVLQAQQAGIAAVRPGAVMRDVDAAARQVIERAGLGKLFGHGLGHGIGLQVHEQPRLAANHDRPLKAGMVVTVEPGIYVPGWGGVRIEDDVLVTRSGHEVLSRVPKEFGDCVLT